MFSMGHLSGLWRIVAIVAAVLLSYAVAGLLWSCDSFIQQFMGACMVFMWLSWAFIGYRLIKRL